MDVLYCHNCGAPLAPDARFCEACGARVSPPGANPPERRKGGGGKAALIIALSVLVLALAAAALWFFVLRGGDAPEPPETGQQGGLVLTTPGPAPSVTIPPTPKPTPEPTPEPVALESTDAGFMDRAPCTRVFFSRAESSSMIVHNGTSYGPDRAIDGDPNTSWQENAPGYGLGETLTLYFDGARDVRVFGIFPGFDQSDYAWNGNARPSRMLVELSDGSEFEIRLPDSRAWQYFEFSAPVSTEYLRFTILDVYPGAEWEDTAITDICAWA